MADCLLRCLRGSRCAVTTSRIHAKGYRCVIDECQNFVTPSIETILRETGKYKFFLTLCQQDVGGGMSPETRRIVTGMAQTKITTRVTPDQREGVARLFDLSAKEVGGLGRGRFLAQFGIDAPVIRFRSRDVSWASATVWSPLPGNG